MKGEGMVLHSFDGEQIYFIDDLTDANINENPLELSIPKFWDSSKEDYDAAFEKIKSELDTNSVQKVVLSRTITTEVKDSPAAIFNRLNERYDNSFNYLLRFESGLCWIGATPELLIEKDGLSIKSMSLAGTKSAGLDSKWSFKEKEEHQFVTDHIKTVLESTDCKDIELYGPRTVNAGFVDHLLTEISATMSSEDQFNNILQQLHPTPAVCGMPTKAAQELIQEIETHEREFYTGIIGIRTKKSERYFVNLRCMQLNKGNAMLYVGGGITGGSILDAEWEETNLKAQTLLDLIS
ncbi:chorismate-binding protein [Crocinitomix catalasitica]|nr:chorismate-binding protein [Crocinitomix catalasitica]